MAIRALSIFIGYMVLIVAFALSYTYIPYAVDDVFGKFWEALYFSVVTVTTLGYGEITPSNGIGRLLVGAEAISGVLAIGLLLTFLGQAVADRITTAQAKTERRIHKEINEERLIAYLPHTLQIIADFKDTFAFVTTSGMDRKTAYRVPFKTEFQLSDMRELYKGTGRSFSGYDKPVVVHYYSLLEYLINDFRFVLANFQISSFGSLENEISEFIRSSYNPSIDTKITEDFYSNNVGHEDSFASLVETNLASFEGKDLGAPEVHTFAAIQRLHQQLLEQATVLPSIEEALTKIVRRADV